MWPELYEIDLLQLLKEVNEPDMRKCHVVGKAELTLCGWKSIYKSKRILSSKIAKKKPPKNKSIFAGHCHLFQIFLVITVAHVSSFLQFSSRLIPSTLHQFLWHMPSLSTKVRTLFFLQKLRGVTDQMFRAQLFIRHFDRDVVFLAWW